MKVVDLRNIFANCNDQLIEISDNRIYYAEEKNEEGHNSIFLLEYNRITRRERILANYILDRPAFVPAFFQFFRCDPAAPGGRQQPCGAAVHR